MGWLRAEDQTILSMGDRRVTHSPRFFVTLENAKTKNQTQSREDEEATWQLHIRALKEADRGCYMCQLNTKPMLSQLGCVDVLGMPNCTRLRVPHSVPTKVCGCWQRRHARTHCVSIRSGHHALGPESMRASPLQRRVWIGRRTRVQHRATRRFLVARVMQIARDE